MRYVFFLLITGLSFFAIGQDRSAEAFIGRISTDGAFPKDLLEGKSLLLLMCDESVSCDNWKTIAEETQPVLANAGIDAVATYYFEDILSGVEPFRTFLSSFEDRNITHLVVMRHSSSGYDVYLTEFNKNEFIKEGQPGWHSSSPELRTVLQNTQMAAENSGQKLKNFLILNQPEYGTMVDIFTGRRAEFYDLNFSSDKLAIYPFADTSEIRAVMEEYPYEYEIIDPSIPEKELRTEGFDFVLYYVHTRAENTKRLLGYEVNEKESSYVSEAFDGDKPVLKTYSRETPVYKFYIKQVQSGNIFLGKKWDAEPRWQAALSNYIALLRKELVRN